MPLSITDRGGHTSTFSYDERGNLLSEKDPLGHTTRYRYDPQGQVVEIIDAHDKHKTLAWNRYGQLLLYRDCSNSESHLLRVTFTDHQGAQQTLSYAYDALGQLLSESSDAGELGYRYDALGSLETLTLPDQRQLNHLYYGSGHLHQLNLNGRVIYDAGMLKPYKTGSPAPPASQRLHRAVFAFALHHS